MQIYKKKSKTKQHKLNYKQSFVRFGITKRPFNH